MGLAKVRASSREIDFALSAVSVNFCMKDYWAILIDTLNPKP